MSKTAPLSLLVTLCGLAAPLATAAPAMAESIPPNCTLDPFTGKLNCHIWPSCTLDPFTGKMNCPAPKATTRILRRVSAEG